MTAPFDTNAEAELAPQPLAPRDQPALPRPVPEPSPAEMPMQVLGRAYGPPPEQPPGRAVSPRRLLVRRALVLGMAVLLSLAATVEMEHVLRVGGLSFFEVLAILLFAPNFAWITLGLVSAVTGFAMLCLRRRYDGLVWPAAGTPLRERTAILMPTYNETPSRLFAGIEAMDESLAATGQRNAFDLFILSDTTDPDIWVAEQRGWAELCRRTGGAGRIFYRRRPANIARKAGNIADFCRRWGKRYAHMIVLDADSLMSGDALVTLAALMEANPDAGLIQTVPQVVNRHSLFARLQQFAGRLYGPIVAAGFAFWHGGDSNYWGHNAIIRIQAFVRHCGLPQLPGRAPFGGHILSHDFVEAALIRRAGWRVHLVPDIAGSYEESPPSLIDYAVRDRRWCQGNLQHMAVLPAAGLHWMSRLHLAMGIMSFLTAPLCLLLMAVGLAADFRSLVSGPTYFPDGVTLYPVWPRTDPAGALLLFVIVVAVLLLPKLLSFVLLMLDGPRRRAFGGAVAAFGSLILETLMSALIAPIMMLFQTAAIVSIFAGRDSGWSTQRRDDGAIDRREFVRKHGFHTVLGVVVALAAWLISPPLLLWLSPVILGLALSVPLSMVTASQAAGQWLRRRGLLSIPEERAPPPLLARAQALRASYADLAIGSGEGLRLVVRDPAARALHTALLDPAAPEVRRPVNVDLVVADAKIGVSDSLEEAIAALTLAEQRAVLASARLLRRLAALDRGMLLPDRTIHQAA